MIRKILLATLVATSFGSVPIASMAQPRPGVVILQPPPPRQEAVPAPRRGYEWAGGHWEWRRNQHVWVAGHWVKARPGYAYNAPRWEQRGDRWVMQPGRYERRGPNGDRDRDGVPNAVDRKPNDPLRN